MTKDKQIEGYSDLVLIIDKAIRDWQDRRYACNEEGLVEVKESLAESIAVAVFVNEYHKQVEGETYFDNIEQEIEEALRSNYQARADRIEQGGYDEFVSFIDGKIIALRGIQEFVSSLKIKYKGENKDEMDTE